MEKKRKESGPVPTAPSLTTLNMSSMVTLAEKNPDGDFGEYDPFAHRETTHQYSNMGALAHLLKGSLGSGILAMPLAFLTGPALLRPYATVARRFVTTALFCTYYFGLTAYVVFMAESIKQVVDHYAGKPDIDELSYTRIYIALLVLILIPLSMIRKLKHLVPFSMVANLCIVVGFSITLYYLFDQVNDPATRSYGTSLKGLPIFFATVLFAMEGIGTVLPVENTMREPKRLIGWNGVLTIAMVVVVVLFAGMGFFGYLRYGEDVKGSITLNLPAEEIPAQAVKLLLAVAILFTYPLQMYVAIGIVWDQLLPHLRTSLHEVAQITMRVVMVLGTIVTALAVPKLGPVISLIGALFFSILGLFIPAVVDTATEWVQDGGACRKNVYLFVKNGILVVVSLLSVVAGSYSSVLDIISAYGEGANPANPSS
ncbi:proton-coupled amino acid transporter-like protein CG1139 isoform X2 [Thrips palmi]|uniref:Proton-coupled amino acid transporter-like protein CG1139 isoform X2 n=1 Tax=Thrips palmi TaxID=161013 RepID=A0A6P8YEL1_THRPL|nr:proton-coupled amino acid transporter-like protein CG1139 isoform X2 [Thrips palmi]